MRLIRQTEPTVVAVKRHLDNLNDGLEQLAIYDAELTDESIARVRTAADALRFHIAQLDQVGGIDSELEASAGRIREQFQSDKPWRDISSLDADLESVRGLLKRTPKDPRGSWRARGNDSCPGEGEDGVLNPQCGPKSPCLTSDRRGFSRNKR